MCAASPRLKPSTRNSRPSAPPDLLERFYAAPTADNYYAIPSDCDRSPCWQHWKHILAEAGFLSSLKLTLEMLVRCNWNLAEAAKQPEMRQSNGRQPDRSTIYRHSKKLATYGILKPTRRVKKRQLCRRRAAARAVENQVPAAAKVCTDATKDIGPYKEINASDAASVPDAAFKPPTIHRTGIVTPDVEKPVPVFPDKAKPATPAQPRLDPVQQDEFATALCYQLDRAAAYISHQQARRLYGIAHTMTGGHITAAKLIPLLWNIMRHYTRSMHDPFAYAYALLRKLFLTPPQRKRKNKPSAQSRKPTRAQSKATFRHLQALATTSPPSTGKHRIGSFHSMKGILK